MSDLVQRLRDYDKRNNRGKYAVICREAANEIERLREALEAHNADCKEICANNRKHGRCKPHTDRKLECPDCPKDWMVSGALNSPVTLPDGRGVP